MSHEILFRDEFFGSILYNTFDKEYYFFDNEATISVRRALEGETSADLHEVYHELGTHRLLSKETRFLQNKKSHCLSAPLKVFLDLTYRCNLHCSHCFTNSHLPHPDELTTEEVFSLVRQMNEVGTGMLALAGGEPLVRPDFFDIVQYAVQKNINVGMTTNGVFLTETRARRLNDIGISMITISLDGMEHAHDALRGKGVWKRVVRNLRQIKQFCPSVAICLRYTINALNLKDYEPVLVLAQELGIDMVKFNPIRCFGRAQHHRSLLLTQQQYVQFLTDVQKVQTKVPYSLPKTPLDTCEYEFIDLGFGCTGGKETCNITPTGDFSACAFLGEEFVVGNIKNESLLELWAKTQQTVQYTGNETCTSCSHYKNCRAGCRSRAIFEYGNREAIDPHCTMGMAVAQQKLTIRKEPQGYIVYDSQQGSYRRMGTFANIEKEYPMLMKNKQYRLLEHSIDLPLKVFFDVTHACTSRCIHCYNDSRDASPDELTTDEIHQVAQQLGHIGIHQISIGGGEPFLRKDIFDLIRFFNAYDIEVSITSNGLLITESKAKHFLSCSLKQLTISIDGVTQEKYKELRGVDGLALLNENLSYIHTYFQGELAMRVSLMRGNLNGEQIVEYALRHGFTTLKINKTHALGRFVSHPEYEVSDEEYDACIEYFASLQKTIPLTIELPREKYLNNDGSFPCSAGKKTIFLSPNGEVFPCGFGPSSFSFGSIRQQSFVDILLQNQKFCVDNPHCRTCPGMKKSHHVTNKALITA